MSETKNKSVRVRFAPSPTGQFHIGSARAALFNWLFARQNGGAFVLRIEDTDKERSTQEFEAQIMEALTWLGLDWDEGPDKQGSYGPYRQSERTATYKKYLKKLLDEKRAYYCYCTKEELEAQRESLTAQGLPPRYAGHCRNLSAPPPDRKPQVIRFKTPEREVEFKDIIRGTVKFDASLFGDMAIAKDIETPLYNFAVVVDDEEMAITHVIRGEDHLSNTPKQILFQEALGFKTPEYAHLPLILAKDRSKLSKRYAETSLLSYRDEGYLPVALVNFLVLMGWHPKDDREVLTLREMIDEFELKRIQKAGAIFDEEKLRWLNKEHLKAIPSEALAALIRPVMERRGLSLDEEMLPRAIQVVRERMKTVNEFFDLADFFFELPEYPPALLRWGKDDILATQAVLKEAYDVLNDLKGELEPEKVKDVLAELLGAHGNGSVLWPLRVALSGKEASPDPFALLAAFGKEESLKRINVALGKLSSLF